MFAENLKKLRTNHKLSQEELGLILGYSRTAVSAYELSRNEPSFDDLKKISAYFNVSTDYLLGNENEDIKTRPSEDERVLKMLSESDDLRKLVDLAANLSDSQQAELVSYVAWKASELEK